MKKIITDIKTLAALLMAGAALAACSGDDNIVEEQPANPAQHTYTMTIEATKGGDAATTRALALVTEAVRYEGEARERLIQLLMDMDGSNPEARSAGAVSLMTEMAHLGDAVSISSISKLSSTEKRLDKIRIYVRCNYARPITIEEIASYVGMNRTAFCTFYRKEKGKTFITDLNEFRLEMAAGLLKGHPEIPVSEIAEAVGFGSLPHFVRSFTKWKGVSPGKWRK